MNGVVPSAGGRTTGEKMRDVLRRGNGQGDQVEFGIFIQGYVPEHRRRGDPDA